MAEPVLIYAYDDDAETGVPLSDEDVARGHLEEGWVPMVSCYACDSSIPADAPTGSITFFECVWQLTRLPCGKWMYGEPLGALCKHIVIMCKIRVPIQEDEELLVEPFAIENLQEGMVIACKATAAPAIAIDHVAVCYGRTVDGPRVRLIGYPTGRDAAHNYDIFVVCKRFREPFVLK